MTQYGTVIHGTLRTQDLLEAFSEELNLRAGANQPESIALLIVAAQGIDPDSDDAGYILEELFDTLNEYAPEGSYFGAHEGDGSDFGFWPLDPEQ